MRRIEELDGLRGIAVAMVVFGHSASTVPGGYSGWLSPLYFVSDGGLGVEIFFVLSGYLITSLLIEEKNCFGGISLKDFYKRRILRIFPVFYSYIFLLAVLDCLGLVTIPIREIAVAAAHLWNYGIFVGLQNQALISPQGGIALGHFWSLSLEEQFYWVWPPVFALALIRSKQVFFASLILSMPIVRVLVYLAFPEQRGSLNSMFHTGIDVISFGVSLALFREQLSKLRWVNSEKLVTAAIAFLLLAIPLLHAYFRGKWQITYGRTFESCLCALVILAATLNSTHWYSRLFRNRWLRFIGKISFSLYVWQQLFCLAGAPMTVNFPWGIPISVCVATLSYHLIERPFLSIRWGRREPLQQINDHNHF